MPPKVTNFNTGEVVHLDDDYTEIEYIEDDDEPYGIEVNTPSGTKISLLTQSEADFYNKIAHEYQQDNKFSNISDLLELDRVLAIEVICFRMSTWALLDGDYDGRPLPKDIHRNIKDLSKEIRDIKSGLGIDKKTRDAGQGDTIAEKWENLKARALKFGWMRNEQLVKAVDILKKLESMMTMYKNSIPQERTMFEMHGEDIFEWLEGALKEFNEIDERFKQEQKLWIKEFKI